VGDDNGLFITFEGTDGCGKTTQFTKTCQWLETQGISFVMTREPGGCAISDRIRALLLDPTNQEMHPRTEMLLFAASRAQHMWQVILPALEAGKVVLCDRFVDSSVAYQGYGRGLGAKLVWEANKAAVPRMPDVTIWIDVQPEIAWARKLKRESTDRLENEGLAFQQRLYEGFCAMAGDARFIRIDGDAEEDVVFQRICLALKPLLQKFL